VLLVRRGGGKPGLDFLSHDRSLRLDIEHPPLHLGGTQAGHPTRHVLADLGLEGVAGLHRLGIVHRRQRTPECRHRRAIVFPHSRAELPS
jgi:hypothetical protein